MKTVSLITGGAGFIGAHLAKRLLDRGDDVIIVDNFQRSEADKTIFGLVDRGAEIVQLDLTHSHADIQNELLESVRRATDVYHLAAVNGTRTFYDSPGAVLETNILAMRTVLSAATLNARMPRVLFTSSNEAYAGGLAAGILPIPTPEAVPLIVADPYNPRWSYGASKMVGEMMLIHAARKYEFQAVIVRPHNFYGPRAGTGHVIPQMLERIAAREDPFRVWGSQETRSFCYIDDAVEGMVRAMECASMEVPTFHIGSTTETKIGDLAKMLFEVTGWQPTGMDYLDSPEGSVARRLPDVRKILCATGWAATTPLAEGLRKTAHWYLTQ